MNLTVGICSPGDMGAGLARVMQSHGARVIAAVGHRSARTQALCADAGIEPVNDLTELVAQAQIVLSVVVPSAARHVASDLVDAAQDVAKPPVIVDLNAISPDELAHVASVTTSGGVPLVDGCIIGPPPRADHQPRIFLSGPNLARQSLVACGLDVVHLNDHLGAASGFKMVYGALPKGLTALATDVLTAARRLDVEGPLLDEFARSQSGLLEAISHLVVRMPPKAHRWGEEMRFIADTLEGVGIGGGMFHRAAQTFDDVAATTLGQSRPETWDPSVHDLAAIAAAMAQQWGHRRRQPPDTNTCDRCPWLATPDHTDSGFSQATTYNQ